MSQKVKVSIIIPVFNIEQYLKQCLDSIVNQKFSDFEVICINDGSTDNSLKILNEYAKNDSRFVVISQENQGQGVARNNALNIAKGEYIVFVDPDDYIELNMLDELTKAFEETKAEVIQFNFRIYYQHSDELHDRNIAERFKNIFDYELNSAKYYNWRDLKEKFCLYEIGLAPWCRAYSKEFLKRINAKFAPEKYGEDQLFSYIVILNVSNIYYLNRYLYTYRFRQDSASHSNAVDLFCIFNIISQVKTYLTEHNLYEDLKENFSSYKLHQTKRCYRLIAPQDRKKYKSACRKCLIKKEYKEFKNFITELEFQGKQYSFWEQIFSIKNERHSKVKHKVVTLLGVKIKIRVKQAVN